jgi:hypothetical protein
MTQTLYCNPALKSPAECDPPNITDDSKCKDVPYITTVLRENIQFTTPSRVNNFANFLCTSLLQLRNISLVKQHLT